jgi:excisionase family DNA binding protein
MEKQDGLWGRKGVYMQNVYTLHSLSRMLQVSTRTIRREMEDGRISFVRIRGRVRFRQADLQAYLDYCTGDVAANAERDAFQPGDMQQNAG